MQKLKPYFARIPLSVRMTMYGLTLVPLLLIGFPLLFSSLDRWMPGLNFELGWMRLLGGMGFVFFLSIYVYCSYWLVSSGRGAFIEFDPPKQLVTGGPFAYSRNPIALSVVGMLGSAAISLSSAGALILFMIAVPVAHIQVVWLEEPLLKKRFGQAYEHYADRVPRWVPRLFGNTLHTSDAS